MKRTFCLILTLTLLAALTGCSGKRDSLRFVEEHAVPANVQCAGYEVAIGNKVKSAKLIAELWQNGVCTESTPMILDSRTEELHIRLTLDGFGSSKGIQGLQVQIAAGESPVPMTTYFTLPSPVLGYSFTAYDDGEVLETEPETNAVLGAMAFDTGDGVRSIDCKKLAEDSDYVAGYSCLLLIRSSFTSEQLSPEQTEADETK